MAPPDPPRRPTAPGTNVRLPRPAVEVGPALPPRHVDAPAGHVGGARPAFPPEPGSSPEAAPVPQQRAVRVERGEAPDSGRGSPQSVMVRGAVSVVDRVLGAGGKPVALLLALALLAYVSPPAITATGSQLAATIREWRQPDMARELARATARLDRVIETVEREASRVANDRREVERLVSEASARIEQGRDDDRAALLVAFEQIDQLASLMRHVQLPIVLHESLPRGAISTEPPPAGTSDRRHRVTTTFPGRPTRYARR